MFPDLGLSRTWTLEQLRKLFSAKPEVSKDDDVDMVYLDRIHDFLGAESSNLRMASVICFLYLYSVIMEDILLPMEIHVQSEIPLGAGLGSSAALSVCLAAGLTGVLHQVQQREKNIFNCLDSGNTRNEVCKRAFLSEKILHGTPSGIDNSVSSFGGIIKFVNGSITSLPTENNRSLNVLLVNTNVERNTKNLVASVRSRYESHPRIIKPILDSIEGISQDFLDLLETAGDSLDIRAMEELIDYNHGLLKTLGVSHPALENVIRICASFGLHGKLTGAGGGGFAFVLIPTDFGESTVTSVREKLSEEGFTVLRTKVGGGGVTVSMMKQ